jgi:hypothetical protein
MVVLTDRRPRPWAPFPLATRPQLAQPVTYADHAHPAGAPAHLSTARANATRCFSPPLSRRPRSPTRVA